MLILHDIAGVMCLNVFENYTNYIHCNNICIIFILYSYCQYLFSAAPEVKPGSHRRLETEVLWTFCATLYGKRVTIVFLNNGSNIVKP